LIYSILDEEPEPVQNKRPDISSELQQVVNRTMQKDPDKRYQSMKNVLIDLKRVRRETDQVHHRSLKSMPVTDKNRPTEKAKKRHWIGAAAAAVLMILVLWFAGQKFIRKNGEVAATRENSVAVMYFDDHSGEDNFGKILTEMLTSNLSRCKQINVMSSQYLFDILKRMGKEDIETIDRSVATDVAASARVQTMLLGSVYKIGSTLNINAQLCDVKTGSVIGPAQAQGGQVEDIYQMVNKLTEDVIQLMDISSPEDSQPLKINDVTTYSFEAYKHYQKGLEYTRRWNWQDGRNEFREAVRIDTTFAMAHCYLAYSTGIFKIANPLSDLSSERENMRIANKYSQKATDREGDIINTYSAFINRDYHSCLARAKSLAEKYPGDTEIYSKLSMANFLNGNYREAAEADSMVLEINPESANTYNMLSYYYSAMNDHEKAISAVRNYIALQPDVSNTYDSAFEIYLTAGQYDAAYQICEEALKINPQWNEFRQDESYILLFRGEAEKAREKIRNVVKLDPSWELDVVNDLGCFNMYEGRYRAAAGEFQNAVNLAHKKDDTESEINARLVLGKFYSVAGKYSKAIKEFSAVKERSEEVYGQSYNTWPVRAEYYSGVALIDQGDYDRATATAEMIKNYIVQDQYDDILLDYYYLLLAEVYMKKAQLTAAANMIGKVSGFTRGNFSRCRSLKADLLVQQDRLENAIHAYQEFYDDWGTTRASFGGDFFDYFLERSLVPYKLAQLYETRGNRQQAVLTYQKALGQWKNADEDLPELTDVKARLSELSGEN
jgi:tetratricopeptide (TPR) repeat protein/TolB-like protein